MEKQKVLRGKSPYNGALTREQFLFCEMRTTAKLMMQGLSSGEIAEEVARENLFQYPTERSIQRMVRTCMIRLKALEDPSLVALIATQPTEPAKQVCLYAMMKQSRLVWDFMITVIGEKYRLSNLSYGKIDLNTFFMHLQEQDDVVASWSSQTITKLKQVLNHILVENEYLDSVRADHINPVWLYSDLESAIREKGELVALPAFNCFL